MAFNFNTGQLSCTESPQPLSSLSDAFTRLTISNIGSANAFIGGSGVSITGGFALPATQVITLDLENVGELYGGAHINTVYVVGSGGIVTWMASK